MANPSTVDEYIAALPDWRAEVVTAIREVVRKAAPGLQESIKWAQPVYESGGPVCYIRAYAKHVNFGFWRGAQLDDPKGLLLGDGEKMRNVKITAPGDLVPAVYAKWVKQAVKLNAEHGDPSR